METAKSTEMPFRVAVVLTLAGVGMLLLYIFAWVGPALRGRYVDRETTADVLEGRMTRLPGHKGPTRYGLEARVGFAVDGQRYETWVNLPRTTRETQGPEAEAVRTQVVVGQRLQCFYNPFDPGGGVLLERPKLEWAMLGSLVFASAFLLGGIAGMATSWNRTFPRGIASETVDIVRRLPRSFYLALVGTAAAGAVLAKAVIAPHGWPRNFALCAAIGLLFVLIRRVIRVGSVAWPSQERRVALGRAAGHPAAGDKPIRPAIPPWAPEPVAAGRGKCLAVRLAPSPQGVALESSFGPMLVFFIWLGFSILFGVSSHSAGHPGALAPVSLSAGAFLSVIALAIAFRAWRRNTEWVSGLNMELSRHPLRAGEQYEVALVHKHTDRLDGLRVELTRVEQATVNTQRGRKRSCRGECTEGRVIFDQVHSGKRDAVRRGHLRVPRTAVPSLALKHCRVDWSLVLRLEGRIAWTVRYPVIISAQGPPAVSLEATPASALPATEGDDDGPVNLWLEGGPSFPPGGSLVGGYTVMPVVETRLESRELSVLWETAGSGTKELAVYHYDDRAADDGDDRALYGTTSFAIALPDGPPSYEGKCVKICWRVRLRLRYTDGGELLREQPFRLGHGEA